MELIRVLRLLTGCSLADAKGTVQHLAPKPGTCPRCSRAIPPEPLVVDLGELEQAVDLLETAVVLARASAIVPSKLCRARYGLST